MLFVSFILSLIDSDIIVALFSESLIACSVLLSKILLVMLSIGDIFCLESSLSVLKLSDVACIDDDFGISILILNKLLF